MYNKDIIFKRLSPRTSRQKVNRVRVNIGIVMIKNSLNLSENFTKLVFKIFSRQVGAAFALALIVCLQQSNNTGAKLVYVYSRLCSISINSRC